MKKSRFAEEQAKAIRWASCSPSRTFLYSRGPLRCLRGTSCIFADDGRWKLP